MTIPLVNSLTIAQKEATALSVLEECYLNDSRPLCVAYSGGKDSSVILYLTVMQAIPF